MNITNENILRDAGVDVATRSLLRQGIDLYRIPGGEAAVTVWHTLREQAVGLRGWPVIIGAEREVKCIIQCTDNDFDVQGCLASVPTGSPITARHKSRLAGVQAMLREYEKRGMAVPDFLEDLVARASAVSDVLPPPPADVAGWHRPQPHRETISSAYAAPDEPLASCVLAVIQGAAPTDVPAYLPFGGFNSCPAPNVQVAFLRHWQRRCGAIPAAVNHDVIELYVPNPVATAAEAWTVACEHDVYCGEDMLDNTERALQVWGSQYWHFWWD